MAKRKPVEAIKLFKKGDDVKIEQPPSCYGTRVPTCRPDFCGRWFDKCEATNGANTG